MPEYWLDSNVFIEGKKGPYRFDVEPRFWALIDEMVDAGRISSSLLVYDELIEGQDDLSTWARERRTSGLFLDPAATVQGAFATIVAYVSTNYPDTNSTRKFLNRADPWIIACAMVLGGTVVTLETKMPEDSPVVKIPNVCDHFEVLCVTTDEMLQELGVAWCN